MRTLIAFIAIILLASCGSKKPLTVGIDTVVKDSVVITESFVTVYDTIIIPRDTMTIIVPLEDLNFKPKTLKSKDGRSSVSLSRKQNNIIATAICDSLEQIIAHQERTIKEQRFRLEQKTIKPEPIIIKESPWLTRMLAWIGGIGLGIIIIPLLLQLIIPGFSIIQKLK